MTKCPKCGSRNIAGPKYRVSEYGTERLWYQCVCGYAESRPTKDAKADPPTDSPYDLSALRSRQP